MDMNIKIKNLLGLAAKSGRLVSGEETCINYLKKDAIRLIIIPEDASDNTKKKFKDKADYRDIPIYTWQSKTELGNAIGKTSRTSVGVLDKGFANAIIKYLQK